MNAVMRTMRPLAVLAIAVGGLSVMVAIAMWVPVFILSPCTP